MQIRELLVESSNLINFFQKDPDAIIAVKFLHQFGGVPSEATCWPTEDLNFGNTQATLIQGSHGWIAVPPFNRGSGEILFVSGGQSLRQHVLYTDLTTTIRNLLVRVLRIYEVTSTDPAIRRKERFQRKGLDPADSQEASGAALPDPLARHKIPSEATLPERLFKPYSKRVFADVRRRIRKFESNGVYKPIDHPLVGFRDVNELLNELVSVSGDRADFYNSEAGEALDYAYARHATKLNNAYKFLGDEYDGAWSLWRKEVSQAALNLGIDYSEKQLTNIDLTALLSEIVNCIVDFFIKVFFEHIGDSNANS